MTYNTYIYNIGHMFELNLLSEGIYATQHIFIKTHHVKSHCRPLLYLGTFYNIELKRYICCTLFTFFFL